MWRRHNQAVQTALDHKHARNEGQAESALNQLDFVPETKEFYPTAKSNIQPELDY